MSTRSHPVYEMALSRVRGIRFSVIQKLIQHFGQAESVFRASVSALLQVDDIGPATVRVIKSFRDFDLMEAEWAELEKKGVQVLFFTHPAYPRRLWHCADAPPLLFYKGHADLNDARMLAVVGSRHATDYGKEWTKRIIQDMREERVVIISGLAHGIDAVAHQAAMDNGLPTIGVMAHGFSRVYPPWHHNMAEQMTEEGGLLTEYFLEDPFAPYNFPARNRIVAGLCDALLVTETAVKGGAMITCKLAASYHRDVFALPGRIGDAMSAGCHYLIKTHQAGLIESGADILQAMNWETAAVKDPVRQQRLAIDLQPDEQVIFTILGEGDKDIDELIYRSGQTPGKLSGILLQMELAGYIASLPGKRYQRNAV